MTPVTTIELHDDAHTELFSQICDVAERTWCHLDPDDGLFHTSDEARTIARAVFTMFGVTLAKPLGAVEPPDDMPLFLLDYYWATYSTHGGDLDKIRDYLTRQQQYLRRTRHPSQVRTPGPAVTADPTDGT